MLRGRGKRGERGERRPESIGLAPGKGAAAMLVGRERRYFDLPLVMIEEVRGTAAAVYRWRLAAVVCHLSYVCCLSQAVAGDVCWPFCMYQVHVEEAAQWLGQCKEVSPVTQEQRAEAAAARCLRCSGVADVRLRPAVQLVAVSPFKLKLKLVSTGAAAGWEHTLAAELAYRPPRRLADFALSFPPPIAAPSSPLELPSTPPQSGHAGVLRSIGPSCRPIARSSIRRRAASVRAQQQYLDDEPCAHALVATAQGAIGRRNAAVCVASRRCHASRSLTVASESSLGLCASCLTSRVSPSLLYIRTGPTTHFPPNHPTSPSPLPIVHSLAPCLATAADSRSLTTLFRALVFLAGATILPALRLSQV